MAMPTPTALSPSKLAELAAKYKELNAEPAPPPVPEPAPEPAPVSEAAAPPPAPKAKAKAKAKADPNAEQAAYYAPMAAVEDAARKDYKPEDGRLPREKALAEEIAKAEAELARMTPDAPSWAAPDAEPGQNIRVAEGEIAKKREQLDTWRREREMGGADMLGVGVQPLDQQRAAFKEQYATRKKLVEDSLRTVKDPEIRASVMRQRGFQPDETLIDPEEAAAKAFPQPLLDAQETRRQEALRKMPLAAETREEVLGNTESDAKSNQDFIDRYSKKWLLAHGYGATVSGDERRSMEKESVEAAKFALRSLQETGWWALPLTDLDKVEDPDFGDVLTAFIEPKSQRTRGGTATIEGPGSYVLNRLGIPGIVITGGLKTLWGGNPEAMRALANDEPGKALWATLYDAAKTRESATEVVLAHPQTIQDWEKQDDALHTGLVYGTLAGAVILDVITPDALDTLATIGKAGELEKAASDASSAMKAARTRGASIRETIAAGKMAYSGDALKLADSLEAAGHEAEAQMIRDRVAGAVAQHPVGRVTQKALGSTPGELGVDDVRYMQGHADTLRDAKVDLSKQVSEAQAVVDDLERRMQAGEADVLRPERDAAQAKLDGLKHKLASAESDLREIDAVLKDPREHAEAYNELSRKAQGHALESFDVPDEGAKASQPVESVLGDTTRTEPITEPGIRSERELGEVVPSNTLERAASAGDVLEAFRVLKGTAPKTLVSLADKVVAGLKKDVQVAPLVAELERVLARRGKAGNVELVKALVGVKGSAMDNLVARAHGARLRRQLELDASLARVLKAHGGVSGNKLLTRTGEELADAVQELAAARAEHAAARAKRTSDVDVVPNMDGGPNVTVAPAEVEDVERTVPGTPAERTIPEGGRVPAGDERTPAAPRKVAVPAAQPEVAKVEENNKVVALDPAADDSDRMSVHRAEGIARSLEALNPVDEAQRAARFGPSKRMHYAGAGEPYLAREYVQRPPMEYATRDRAHLLWLALKREHSSRLSAGKYLTGVEAKDFAKQFGLPFVGVDRVPDAEWFRVEVRTPDGAVRNYHGRVKGELLGIKWSKRSDAFWRQMEKIASKTPELEPARAMNEYLRSLLWKSDPFDAERTLAHNIRLNDLVYVGDPEAAKAAGPLYQITGRDGEGRLVYERAVTDGFTGRVTRLEDGSIEIQPFEKVDGRAGEYRQAATPPVKVSPEVLEYLERGRTQRVTVGKRGGKIRYSGPMTKAEWADLRKAEAAMPGVGKHTYKDTSRFLDLNPPRRPTTDDFNFALSSLPPEEREAAQAALDAQSVRRGVPTPRWEEMAARAEPPPEVDRPTVIEERAPGVVLPERKVLEDRPLLNEQERIQPRVDAAQRRVEEARRKALEVYGVHGEGAPEDVLAKLQERQQGLAEAEAAVRKAEELKRAHGALGTAVEGALKPEQARLEEVAGKVRESEINKAQRDAEAMRPAIPAHVTRAPQPAERIFKSQLREMLAKRGLSGLQDQHEAVHDSIANALMRTQPDRFPTKDAYFAQFILREGGDVPEELPADALLHATGREARDEAAAKLVMGGQPVPDVGPAPHLDGKAHAYEIALRALEANDGNPAFATAVLKGFERKLSTSSGAWVEGAKDGLKDIMHLLDSPSPQRAVAIGWAHENALADGAAGLERRNFWQGMAVGRFGEGANETTKQMTDFLLHRKTFDFKPTEQEIEAFPHLETARTNAEARAKAADAKIMDRIRQKTYAPVEPSPHFAEYGRGVEHTKAVELEGFDAQGKPEYVLLDKPVLHHRMGLEQIEDTIRSEHVEHMAVLVDGRVVLLAGPEQTLLAGLNPRNTAHLTSEEVSALRKLSDSGAQIVLTHNHPGSRAGSVIPFSTQDLACAANVNAAEIRVVGSGGAPGYSILRPPEGWDEAYARYVHFLDGVKNGEKGAEEARYRATMIMLTLEGVPEGGFAERVLAAQRTLSPDTLGRISRAVDDIFSRTYTDKVLTELPNVVPSLAHTRIPEGTGGVRRVVLDVGLPPAESARGAALREAAGVRAPEPGGIDLGRARPGLSNAFLSAVQRHDEGAIRKLWGHFGLEVRPGEKTGNLLKIYPLWDAFGTTEEEVSAKLDAWLKDQGWSYKIFGPDREGKGFAPPNFREFNYQNKNVWIYQPADPHGSFRDYSYTLPWRVTHEVAHGETDELLTKLYGGPGRRQGALGVPTVFKGRDVPPLSLADALRAVEWETYTFERQREHLEKLGVKITDEMFRKENAINTSDAMVRVLSGDFTSPGDFGAVPTAIDPAELSVKAKNTLRAAALTMGLDMREVFTGAETAERAAQAAKDAEAFVNSLDDASKAGVRDALDAIPAGKDSAWSKAVRKLVEPQRAPTFYSKLERVVGDIRQEKMTAEQLRAMLASGGVKAEELEARQVEAYLKANPKPTKSSFQAWLAEHPYEISEKILHSNPPKDPAFEAEWQAWRTKLDELERIESEANSAADEAHRAWGAQEYARFGDDLDQKVQEARKAAAQARSARRDFTITEPKPQVSPALPMYKGYSTHGGTEYREVLLKHPDVNELADTSKVDKALLEAWLAHDMAVYEDALRASPDFRQHVSPDAYYTARKEDITKKLEQRFTTSGDRYDRIPEYVRVMPEYHARVALDKAAETGSTYRAPHFGKHRDRLLAHTRYQDMTLDNGAPVLHVNEMQSDLHQHGRDSGYYDPTAASDKDAELYEAWQAAAERRRTLWDSPAVSDAEWQAAHDATESAYAAWQENGAALDKANPDARVQHKQSWPELLAKRTIREAAEGDYTGITWTTGKEQIERYSEEMRRNVDEIRWSASQEEPGHVDVTAYYLGSNVHAEEYPLAGRKLEETFGRDVAAKIRAEARGSVTGEDLSVGGEGMKSFYDERLKQTFQKLGKKYGVRPELREVVVPSPTPTLESVARQMFRESYDGLHPHLQDQVRARLDAELRHPDPPFVRKVWYMPLTKEMREDALYQGFPLFHAKGEAVHGTAQALEDGRAVLTFYKTADMETFLHEHAHAWLWMLSAEDKAALTQKYGSITTRASQERFVKDVLDSLKRPDHQLPTPVYDAFRSIAQHLKAVGEDARIPSNPAAKEILTKLLVNSEPPPVPVAVLPGRGNIGDLGREAEILDRAKHLQGRRMLRAKAEDYTSAITKWFSPFREVEEAPFHAAFKRTMREADRLYEDVSRKITAAVKHGGSIDAAFSPDTMQAVERALRSGPNDRLLDAIAVSHVDPSKVVFSDSELAHLRDVVRNAPGNVSDRSAALRRATEDTLARWKVVPPGAMRPAAQGEALFAYGAGTAGAQYRALQQAVGDGAVLSAEDAKHASEWLAGNSSKADLGRNLVLGIFEDPFNYKPDLEEIGNLRREEIKPFAPFSLSRAVERLDVLGDSEVYVPRAFQKKLLRQIEEVEQAAQPYSGGRVLLRWWRQGKTMGVLTPRPKFYFDNAFEDLTQAASVGGFGPAAKASTHSAMQNLLAIPGVANGAQLADYIRGQKPGTLIKELSDVLAWGHFNEDVSKIINEDDVIITIGGRPFNAAELGRIAGRQGVGENFNTGVLREQLADVMHPRGKLSSILQANIDAVNDVADLISKRQRYGFFRALIEAGFEPERAGQMVVDATYDYAHSLHPWERTWVRMVHPFWAFEKNNARRVARAMLNPGTWVPYATRRVYQTHMIKRDATALITAAFDTRDDFGIDRASMDEDDPRAAAAYDAALARWRDPNSPTGWIPNRDPRSVKILIRNGDVPEELIPAVRGYWQDDPMLTILPEHLHDRYLAYLPFSRAASSSAWLRQGSGKNERAADDRRAWVLPDDANASGLGLMVSAMAFLANAGVFLGTAGEDPGAVSRIQGTGKEVLGDITTHPVVQLAAGLTGVDLDKPDVPISAGLGAAVHGMGGFGRMLVTRETKTDAAETADTSRSFGSSYKLSDTAAAWADVLSLMPLISLADVFGHAFGPATVGKEPPMDRAVDEVGKHMLGADVQPVSTKTTSERLDSERRRKVGDATADISRASATIPPLSKYQTNRDARQVEEKRLASAPTVEVAVWERLDAKALAPGDLTTLRALMVRNGADPDIIDAMDDDLVGKLAYKMLQKRKASGGAEAGSGE